MAVSVVFFNKQNYFLIFVNTLYFILCSCIIHNIPQYCLVYYYTELCN